MNTKQTEALKLALKDLERSESAMHKARAIIREALAEQPAQQQEPVAWRDHVEQRLLTWRQSFVNKSGDQLALDDFMDKRSLDDLIDFVCSEYTSPPASKPWQGLTDEERDEIYNTHEPYADLKAVEAKLREKNA